MPLLTQTNSQYYNSSNAANYGDYQYVKFKDIVNQFIIAYVGGDKIISKVRTTDVAFHAQRALQEFSYDVFKSVKSQEIEIPPSLKMILPQDFVNYVKITKMGDHGTELPLYPTMRTSNPIAILQDGNFEYTFDGSGNLLTASESDTWSAFKTANEGTSGSNEEFEDELHNKSIGTRYGIDPQHANQNGSFYIDYVKGFIHFSSNLSEKTVTLKYITDGLGTAEDMIVHKFAEEAMYKYIAHAILATKSDTPEYLVQRFKKEKRAATRTAKLRLSNIKIEELTQVMRGKSKQIKH
tara:strand:+ start:7642 stop:8526 length:885 start_codon:yes stop_codon:yes gene_type:complete